MTVRLSPPQEGQWPGPQGEIRALAPGGRYRYRDIAVAAWSMAPYWEQLEEIFAQYDIPSSSPTGRTFCRKPIFTLVTAALDAVTGGYAYEDMFRYLKTGLAGLTWRSATGWRTTSSPGTSSAAGGPPPPGGPSTPGDTTRPSPPRTRRPWPNSTPSACG